MGLMRRLSLCSVLSATFSRAQVMRGHRRVEESWLRVRCGVLLFIWREARKVLCSLEGGFEFFWAESDFICSVLRQVAIAEIAKELCTASTLRYSSPNAA